VLRVLAALSLIGTHEVSKGEEDWEEDSEQVSLNDLRKIGLEHALYAREYLASLDRRIGAMKNIGSEIAVGFPESSDKAKERFVPNLSVQKGRSNFPEHSSRWVL
jgi:hypothetical protein